MTIEKIPDKRIDKTWLDSACANKINEIIDYLNSKDHIVEKHEMVEKDWIDQAFDKYYNDPDADVYSKNTFRDAIEEYMPKHIHPVTSTIEDVAKKVLQWLYTYNWWIEYMPAWIDKDVVKETMEILSSLSPIQKKFTQKEIDTWCEESLCLSTKSIAWFLKDHNLLQE